MTRYCLIFCLGLVLLSPSCKVDPKIVAPVSNDVRELIPPGFPDPNYSFVKSNNAVTPDRFALGRALFYETMLSIDNTVSCGSCHQQRVAFANEDHALSHGVADKAGLDQLGKRNAPPLFNLAWHPYFMYDGRALNMEVQPVLPICNPVEMGESMPGVIAKLQASAKYRRMFKNAWGTDTVTSQRLLQALTQFMGLIYSYNSKFDHYKRNENKVTLNDSELRGYDLFRANCNSCHSEPLFTDFAFRDIGLKVDPSLNDSGRADYTGLPQDLHKFKTPSLRNISRTYPYMHDGRYSTMDQCLDHSGANPALTDDQKKDLISFLNTLTDDQFALPLDQMDARFSDPNGH